MRMGDKIDMHCFEVTEGGGVCGNRQGSYRTLSEQSERITPPQRAPNQTTSLSTGRLIWYARCDSNAWPSESESDALSS